MGGGHLQSAPDGRQIAPKSLPAWSFALATAPVPSLVDFLAKSMLFGTLSEAERQAVAAQMRRTSFDSGQMIFARGDAGTEVYLVISGRVRLSIVTAEGRELSFVHAGPGSIFGEIATLDGGPRTADAMAVGPVEAMVLSHTVLRRMIETTPALASAAVSFLCRRLREADQQLEAVALHPIEVRLARFLLGLAAQRSPAQSGRQKIDLGMSQTELSLLLGASRPKVNAALSLLEDQGAIERNGNLVDCELAMLRDIGQVD